MLKNSVKIEKKFYISDYVILIIKLYVYLGKFWKIRPLVFDFSEYFFRKFSNLKIGYVLEVELLKNAQMVFDNWNTYSERSFR